MEREMVNIARFEPQKIAEDIDEDVVTVGKVVNYIKKNRGNGNREPPPPAPPGGIGIREASRKYGIPSGTISRWRIKHNIPVLLETKNILYLDDAVLSELVKRYNKNPGRGKRHLELDG